MRPTDALRALPPDIIRRKRRGRCIVDPPLRTIGKALVSSLKELVLSLVGHAPSAESRELFLLAELSQAFAQSLDVEETLRNAADNILHFLDAEAASIFLLDESGKELVCRTCAGPSSIVGLRLPVGTGIVGRTLSERTWQMVRDVREDPDFYPKVDKDTGFVTRSLMCVPLQVRERTFGVLEVLNKRSGSGLFSEPDLHMLRVLGTAVSLAIHNAQMATDLLSQKRLRQELELARELQQRLLPAARKAPFPLVGINIPAHEVSGDFFDYFDLADGRIGFTIGDVSGKGLNAALLMVRTTSLLRCLGRVGLPLTRLLQQVNAELCETGSRGMFVCVFAGIYDPASGRLSWSNAGFPPPLYRAPDGRFLRLKADAPPLGIGPETVFHEHRLPLNGGALYLYTDGVIEAHDAEGKPLDEIGLRHLIARHTALPPESRLSALVKSLRDLSLRDDTTLLLLEDSQRPACARLSELHVPARPESLCNIRSAATTTLQSAGCSAPLIQNLVLALDEACANVIRHGYRGDPNGQIDLIIEREGPRLVFRLRDYAERSDTTRIRPRDPSQVRPGGLGMHFIDTIMDSWEFQTPTDGAGNLLVMTKTIE